jgi:diadenosine tetraphosphate (Ap4A) HIT family hydrolase
MHNDYLWSASRSKWIKHGKPYKGCIFCGIAKNDPKIPKKLVYKDKENMVIMNIFPYNTGHLEVIPIRHVENPLELTDEEYANLFFMVRKVILLLKKSLKPDGFNVGINIGKGVAGASIDHLHVHVVPRFKNEIGFMESLLGTKVMPETLDQTYRKIIKHVDILKK